MKKERGITLIALIITIIVMLILVGVTVNVALTGGLFDTAKLAAKKTETAKLNEELKTIIVAMNADILAKEEEYIVYSDEESMNLLETALVKLEENFVVDEAVITTENDGERDIRFLDLEGMYVKGLVTIDETAGMYILSVPCKYKDNDVNIIVELKVGDENIQITKFDLMNNQSISISVTGESPEVSVGGNIKSLTDDGVPIPQGFYYVTGTKNTGVVISDNQADENNENGNNGNQFVWVPVKIDPKLNIKIESDQVINEVKILSVNGYEETVTPNSDYFEKTINLTENDTYEVIVKYDDNSVENKLYHAESIYKEISAPYLVLTTLAGFSGTSEEYILQALEGNLKDENPDLNFDTKIDVLKEIVTKFGEDTAETTDPVEEEDSVLKYGGFYIGRYEVGLDGTIKRENTAKSNISFEDAKTATEGMYNDSSIYGIKSSLPSGVAWGRVGEWLIETNNKTSYEIYVSSYYWGHFGSSSASKTGSSEKYCSNNIYDLAGNLREWNTVTENGKTGNCAAGQCYNDGKYTTLVSIGGDGSVVEGSDAFTGYRPILYFYE